MQTTGVADQQLGYQRHLILVVDLRKSPSMPNHAHTIAVYQQVPIHTYPSIYAED